MKTASALVLVLVAGCGGAPDDGSNGAADPTTVSRPIPVEPVVRPPSAPSSNARLAFDPRTLADIAVDRTEYPSGDSVAVSWVAFPGTAGDRVALVGAQGEIVQSASTEGYERGAYVFAPLAPGEYTARAWCAGAPCADARPFVVLP
jgi:hypothetical protein